MLTMRWFKMKWDVFELWRVPLLIKSGPRPLSCSRFREIFNKTNMFHLFFDKSYLFVYYLRTPCSATEAENYGVLWEEGETGEFILFFCPTNCWLFKTCFSYFSHLTNSTGYLFSIKYFIYFNKYSPVYGEGEGEKSF